jgi:hypothetical protein
MSSTTIAVLAVVVALVGVGWYRFKFRALLDDELAITSYLINILYDDGERKRQSADLFEYVAKLPSSNPSVLVAASSIRLIAIAKEQYGHPKGRRDIMALLLSISAAPPKP